jgi:acetyl esterase/lipase
MPIHPAVAGKFHLLEGVSTLWAFLEDPVMEERRRAFDEYPGYEIPAVATRMEEAPGPHGPVPVRVYLPDRAGNAPRLLWMHGGAFIGGGLDMPEADWVAREALMTEVPQALRLPPAVTRDFNMNYLGGPVSRADGYASPH